MYIELKAIPSITSTTREIDTASGTLSTVCAESVSMFFVSLGGGGGGGALALTERLWIIRSTENDPVKTLWINYLTKLLAKTDHRENQYPSQETSRCRIRKTFLTCSAAFGRAIKEIQ